MPNIPQDRPLDSTFALLSEGYEFISNRCARYESDIFETRLMLRKAVCMKGEEAAKVFYEPDRFTRRGALPKSALWLLQDQGSALTLDKGAHRWRKQMFMALMTKDSVATLVELTGSEWTAAIAKWQGQDEVNLFQEVQEILCRAVCRWAGLTLSDEQARERTREFASMIDGAGSVGPRNWRGMMLRIRSERWARETVRAVREGHLQVQAGCPLHVVAWHRDENGNLLSNDVAAVELVNILRPTVAVGRYVVFSALALHEHPQCRQMVAQDDDYAGWFVHEVRRFYPFFPVVGGKVREAFDWRGHHFDKGAWVLLDIYGTNRDDRSWEVPEVFQPNRFRDWDGSPFNLIPQGGGDFYSNHRCPGEWITIALMKQAARRLALLKFDVPEQDFSISLSRMPTLPKSGFVMRNVRADGEATAAAQTQRLH